MLSEAVLAEVPAQTVPKYGKAAQRRQERFVSGSSE